MSNINDGTVFDVRDELMIRFDELYIIADKDQNFDAENLPDRIKIYNVSTNIRPEPYSVDLAKHESFYLAEMYYFAVTQLERDLQHKKIELYYDQWRWRIRATEKHPNHNFNAEVLYHYAKNAEKNPIGNEATNPAYRWKYTKTEGNNG